MILFTLLISLSCFAGFNDLDSGELYQYQTKHNIPKKTQVKVKISKEKKSNLDSTLLKLIEQDQKIATLLDQSNHTLIRKSSSEVIAPLTRLHGVILNSIVAMNVRPSTFVVRITDEGEYEGVELMCSGMSFEKRIPSHCMLMVLDGESYEVNVEVWDMDGASGMIADHYYSGEEKAFLTSSFASFMQGVLEGAKDRIMTPFGQAQTQNAKNQILSGLSSVGSNARETIVRSGEQRLSIGYVNAGKSVILFFKQKLNLEKSS